MKLGNIFCDDKKTIGFIDVKGEHAMIALHPEDVLPICGEKIAKEESVLKAACIPWPDYDNPPYIHADIQLCRSKDKREKMGYAWTQDSAEGKVIYQVRLDVNAIWKRYGVIWFHCHEENKKCT